MPTRPSVRIVSGRIYRSERSLEENQVRVRRANRSEHRPPFEAEVVVGETCGLPEACAPSRHL